jgi:PAS domain S-box-containing protein
MLIIDPDSLDIIYANNAASNFYGRSFEDFRQMKITQIDMMSEQKIKVELSKAEKGIQNHFISKQKLQNNEIHDVDICLIPINNEERTLLCLMVNDISKVNECEEVLLEDEATERNLRYITSKNDQIIKNAISGVVLHKVIFNDDGKPIDCIYLEANPAFEKYTGLKITDVIGKLITEIHPYVKETSLIEIYGNVVLTGIPASFETFNPQQNKHYSVNACKIDDDCFAAIIQDITERKEAESALRNTIGQLRTLVNTIPDCIWIKDVHGTFLGCNPKFERLVGAKQEDIIGKTDYDFVDKELADFFRQKDIETLEAGKPLVNEESVTYADDGHEEYLETIKSPMYDSNGKLIGVLGIGRDVSERKTAEEKIKEEAIRRRIFFEQSNDGIVIIDQNGKIVEANQKYADMLGYPMNELLQLHIWDWDESFSSEKLSEAIRTNDQHGYFKTKHRRKDGSSYDVEVTSTNATICGQNLAYCICRDITERNRTAESLKQAKQQYKHASKLLQEVIESPTDVVIFALDKDYRYITFNKNHQMTMEHIWGSRIEIGVSMLDYIQDPADMQKAKANFDRVLAGEAFTVIEEYGDSSLNRRWYENVYSPLEDDNGNVIGLTLFLTDITESKLAEIELLRKDIQLRTAQSVGNVGSWEIDLTSHIVDASEEARKIYGIEDDNDYTNEYIRNLALPEYHQMLTNSMIDLITKGIRYDVEFKIRRVSDGEIRDIHSAGEYFADRNVVIGMIQDITERKNAEMTLKNSEKQLQTIIDTIPDLLWVKDINGVFITCNHKLEQLLNADIADIIGKTDYDFVDKEVADLFRQKDFETLETGKLTINEEMVTYAADGHQEYLETIKTPMYDSSGKVIGTLGIGRDISERKQAEKSILEERKRLANTIEGTNVGTWEWNIQTGIASFNERWAEMVGYTLYELLPLDIHTWNKLVHPEDKDEMDVILKKHFAGELEIYDHEVRMRHKNGEWVWIHARGKVIEWDDAGKPLLMYGTHADITEKKRTEARFAEETNRRRILIEQSSDGIVVLNDKGEVIEANQKYADMLGYSMSELLQLHVWDWDNRYSPEQLIEYIKNTDESGVRFEVLQRRKDGSFVNVEVSSNGTILNGQNLVFCVCRDITERKQAELLLLQAKALAEESNQIKSEFIANMSHELRTPLNSVIGFSQILNEKVFGDLNEKQMNYVCNIQRSGKHLLELINDILDISKIESGNMEYAPEMTDIKEIMDEITVLTEPLVADKHIVLETNSEFDKLEINVDRMKIKQIMFNLLSNAIKFTPKNGKVWFDSKIINGNIQMSVSDNGIGIPLEKQKTIFEPFKQASSSTSRTHGGTGLGLAIVKYYVEMHSGQIHVESEPGKGSTFTFTIPIDSGSY